MYVIVHQWSDGSMTIMPEVFDERKEAEDSCRWYNNNATERQPDLHEPREHNYYVACVADKMSVTMN